MKIGVLLSVREKATRLPGKVLKNIYDKNVTEHIIDRLKIVKNIDKIIISTSTNKRDDIFESIASSMNVEIYRGSENDKLVRYQKTASCFGLDAVIIVDGDDLLCFPEFVTLTAEALRGDKSLDVVFTKDLPLGAAASGIRKKALDKVVDLKDESDTEVWGEYFTLGENFKVEYIQATGIFNHPNIRMTLDYSEDLLFFEEIFNELYKNDRLFTSYDVMNLLINKRPDICNINAGAQKKYEKHILKTASIKFKKEDGN
jgi:spore coat polysaccharide biosynthesis protein SpsF